MACLALASPAIAQQAANDAWRVTVTPYLMGAAISRTIKAFAAIIHDNNRPTQALNGRAALTEAVSVR